MGGRDHLKEGGQTPLTPQGVGKKTKAILSSHRREGLTGGVYD